MIPRRHEPRRIPASAAVVEGISSTRVPPMKREPDTHSSRSASPTPESSSVCARHAPHDADRPPLQFQPTSIATATSPRTDDDTTNLGTAKQGPPHRHATPPSPHQAGLEGCLAARYRARSSLAGLVNLRCVRCHHLASHSVAAAFSANRRVFPVSRAARPAFPAAPDGTGAGPAAARRADRSRRDHSASVPASGKCSAEPGLLTPPDALDSRSRTPRGARRGPHSEFAILRPLVVVQSRRPI